jgi:hypothetical protein
MSQQYSFNNEDFMIYSQNICGLTYKSIEVMTSLHPKFPQIICFMEHHFKYMQIQQISIENCNLCTSFCGVSSDNEVCIIVYRSLKFIPVSIKEWCKDKDMWACVVKCAFSVTKLCISTIYSSPSNFHLFVTKLETIIKKLYKPDIQIIIFEDINTNCLVESNGKTNLIQCFILLICIVWFIFLQEVQIGLAQC